MLCQLRDFGIRALKRSHLIIHYIICGTPGHHGVSWLRMMSGMGSERARHMGDRRALVATLGHLVGVDHKHL